MEQEGQGRNLVQAGAQAGTYVEAIAGNFSESQTISIGFLHLVLGVRQCVHTPHKQSLGFLQPCCHWLSNQLRGLMSPVSDPRVGL